MKAHTMIAMVWLTWFLLTVFNVVIMLNFLITFISETYEEVYGRDKIDDFANMANLNHECRVAIKPFLALLGENYIGRAF